MMQEYKGYQNMLEEALAAAIPETEEVPAEGQMPGTLAAAMRYSLLAPGKRLRPVLLLAAYRLLADDAERALPFAVSLEMIHTYSLIHDDLPAMDNDDLRRGRPTCHKKFTPGIATLAGDGLLNLAYERLFQEITSGCLPGAARAAEAICRRAGVTGMIAGQMLDVTMEGAQPTEKLVSYIHRHKAADLLTAPMEAGLLLAGADEKQLSAGCAYGYHLGMAFQMVDDLLDIEGEEAVLGKRTGVDAFRGKLTWPALYGVEKTRSDAAAHIDQAVESLSVFEQTANFLIQLAKDTLLRVQ